MNELRITQVALVGLVAATVTTTSAQAASIPT